jgi:AraC-like DNA-binding protein
VWQIECVRYEEHPPSPALTAHVACYWSLESEEETSHRVLPDGCMDLLFDLSGRATIIGTMTRALQVAHPRRTRVFGVRFRPGEAFAFVRVPAADARDGVVPLRDAWGGLSDELAEKIAEAPDHRARVTTLDRELLRVRARPADARVRRVVQRILASPEEARVAWLAKNVGLGERQLERTFDERVGIGPKALARVARLQALVRRIAEAKGRLSHLAADLGYADQAHLAREVKRLSGVTPTELAKEAMRGVAWPIRMT